MNGSIHIPRDDPDYPSIEVFCETLSTVELGCDGSDEWVRFWSEQDDITADEIHKAFLPLVYRLPNAPAGAYFCTSMRAFQTDHLNEVICVIQHRYDV